VGLIAQLSNPGFLLPSDSHERRKPAGERREQQQHVRLSASDLEALAKDRAPGLTIARLAERYGVHRTTVMAHLKRAR